MNNRILKRPMFRMGGRSDDGIMTIRPGYKRGSGLDSPELYLEAEKLKQKPFLSNQKIDEKYEDAIKSADLSVDFSDVEGGLRLPGSFQQKEIAAAEFLKTPEGKAFFKKPLLEQQSKEIEERKALGVPIPDNTINLGSDLEDDQDSSITLDNKPVSTNNEQSDQELIKSYMDMFSEAMGESKEDLSRQRYLELAKFGANLLAQPGGNLIGAIGKAGASSLQGLSDIEARKSASNREVKLAALRTAIAQMDNPTQEKIETLAELSGLEKKDVAKMMLNQDDDSSLDRIKLTVDAIGGEVGGSAALSIAQALEEEGAVLAQARPIEIDKKTKLPKEGVSDGYYYDEEGILYKVKKGKPSTVKIK